MSEGDIEAEEIIQTAKQREKDLTEFSASSNKPITVFKRKNGRGIFLRIGEQKVFKPDPGAIKISSFKNSE